MCVFKMFSKDTFFELKSGEFFEELRGVSQSLRRATPRYLRGALKFDWVMESYAEIWLSYVLLCIY
ncbi:hypothetical protein DIT68_09405 [Brumimicrobium oceani]|uniref:Uncharacterized protein n=1 Tax=Brumimicrobium oceani TaxID=2100725 RepID=A0A2U2XCH0_9FLAO|nr:hypothetical protein DIT68_09405 [Brumimicrobium oceani]